MQRGILFEDAQKSDPGCLHCYAETFAERFRGVPGHPFERGFDPRVVPEKLGDPLRWNSSRMIFVNSMSDLFHDGVSDDYIISVARVMQAANWHTYQVLTKRSERMRDLLNTKLRFVAKSPHIWWGVSVENKKHGLPRIAHLRAAGVTVRFLSIEPLLEDLGRFNLSSIDWAIVGGESGYGARPMLPAWVHNIMRNAVRLVLLFSSNSGEAFARVKRVACLTGELMMSFLNDRKRPCPASPRALLCWKDWRSPELNYGLVELPPKAIR